LLEARFLVVLIARHRFGCSYFSAGLLGAPRLRSNCGLLASGLHIFSLWPATSPDNGKRPKALALPSLSNV
jgi:hypothetical protein